MSIHPSLLKSAVATPSAPPNGPPFTATALKGGPFGGALGVATAEFNNDGWIDIYVANDGRENVLWINQRDGTFKNMGLLAGVALSGSGTPEGSMGVDA